MRLRAHGVKIRRSNYDKPWRCPDWSGPAWKSRDGSCPGGMLPWQEHRLPEWRFFRCADCGTVVLPNVLKWLDPSWLRFVVERQFGA